MTRAHLRPCPGCSRHVRVSEGACPFCAASLDASFRAAPAPVPPSRRLSRAAHFAFGTGTLVLAPAAIVTVALGTDCSGSSAYGAPACEDVNCAPVEPLEDSGIVAADVQVGSADASDGSVESNDAADSSAADAGNDGGADAGDASIEDTGSDTGADAGDAD